MFVQHDPAEVWKAFQKIIQQKDFPVLKILRECLENGDRDADPEYLASFRAHGFIDHEEQVPQVVLDVMKFCVRGEVGVWKLDPLPASLMGTMIFDGALPEAGL